MGCLREVWYLTVVVRDAELECNELPGQSEWRQEEDPHEDEVAVEHVEQGMQTVRHRQLIKVSPDTELDKRVYLHIADVDLALVIVDEVDFNFVVNCFGLVNFDDLLLLNEPAGI